MRVKFAPTEIKDVVVAEVPVFRDDRGFFEECYSLKMWQDNGFPVNFVQDNLSYSAKGTLRGMHYQLEPHAMGKLVRVISGAVYDVAVDLRKGSPTFGKWVGQELSEENQLAIWVPQGFAHGFVALRDETFVYYKCDAYYAPEAERSFSYKDPTVGIEWPLAPTLISAKDGAAPLFENAEFNFTYQDQT